MTSAEKNELLPDGRVMGASTAPEVCGRQLVEATHSLFSGWRGEKTEAVKCGDNFFVITLGACVTHIIILYLA